MHADVDAGVGVAGDAEQLNGVAELAGLGDVLGADGADTLLVHIIGGNAGAKADGGEDGRLAGGIEAVDVGGRVGLGIALGLCIGEHVGVIGALGVHARQDVVGGAVEDAGDGQDLVAHQIVLKRAHDGDAAAAAGLALNLHAARARLLGECLDMTAQQGLVGRETCLPFSKAVVKISVAGCSPPISSTTMSTAGSVTTSCQSLVKASRSIPAASACSQASAQARVSLRSMP